MLFKSGDHIVFIGDSITDCGRRDEHAPYGDGYVGLLRAFTLARHPGLNLSWTNQGISGDTVRDLADRWEADVLDRGPHWLSVMIGTNDVWRGFDGHPEGPVPIDEFTTTLSDLLSRAVNATGCRLILADPYLIESNRDDAHRVTSCQYAEAVASLATKFNAIHVPTQAAFDNVLCVTGPGEWSDDRIHPNSAGHAVIVEAYRHSLRI